MIKPHPGHLLEEMADDLRSKDGQADCLVGLSGGRDSSYALHYIKEVLRMHPVAFTYDWGMVNDLASAIFPVFVPG